MKPKNSKGIRLLILMLMVSLLISACAGNVSNSDETVNSSTPASDSQGAKDNSEEVTLKMVLIQQTCGLRRGVRRGEQVTQGKDQHDH